MWKFKISLVPSGKIATGTSSIINKSKKTVPNAIRMLICNQPHRVWVPARQEIAATTTTATSEIRLMKILKIKKKHLKLQLCQI